MSQEFENLSMGGPPFPTEKVTTLQWENIDKIKDLIKNKRPVVIKGSGISDAALKWNIDYLRTHLGNGKQTVWTSKTNRFKFWNETIAKQIEDKIPFVPPTKQIDMSIGEFVNRIDNWKRGKDWVYLQQQLNDTVGPAIFADFRHLGWDKLESLQKAGNWGPLTSNLLLISQKGNITPAHYDEQENLFAQLVNQKKFYLFPPEAISCLYPYPVLHPHDRQSQADIEEPDYAKYPRLRDLRGFETVVGPGDILYIPHCWWHQVETLDDNCVSITFWYKTGIVDKIEYPLPGSHKLTIMRNIEKMIGEALRDPTEIAPFMQTMVLGRYTDLA